MNLIWIPYMAEKINDMRKILITAVLLTCCLIAFGQEMDSSFVSGSRTAALSLRRGAAIRMECLTSESFSSMSEYLTVEACVVTDLGSGDTECAVRFSGGKSGAYPKYVSTLDEDEIPAFVKTLDYIIKETATTPANPYVHIVFLSRDGLRVGAYWKATDQRRGYGNWGVSVGHTRYAGNPSVTFADTKRLSQIRDAVAKASEALAAAR